MDTIKEKLENVQEISLIKENEDKTKKYMITATEDVDLRKNVFETFAKEGITIFEMKKVDATLEDAFMKLISAENETVEESNEEIVLDKKAMKAKKQEERAKKREEKKQEKIRKKEEKKKDKEAKMKEGGQE